MPISRVRSVTETSMMFMMPMPPTSRLTAAMAPSSAVSTPVTLASVSAISRHVVHREVVLLARADAAALAHQRLDLRAWPGRSRSRVARRTQISADVAVAGDAPLQGRAAASATKSSWSCRRWTGPLAASTPITRQETLRPDGSGAERILVAEQLACAPSRRARRPAAPARSSASENCARVATVAVAHREVGVGRRPCTTGRSVACCRRPPARRAGDVGATVADAGCSRSIALRVVAA